MKSKVIGLSVIVFALAMATHVYAADYISPTDAFIEATIDPDVYILDVRTAEEWKWVGHPGENRLGDGALLEGKVLNIPVWFWKDDQFVPNKKFLRKVKNAFSDHTFVTLIIMGKVTRRAIEAADILESEGYSSVSIMAEGFQGGIDARGYRTVNGWMNTIGLPYTDQGAGYQK